jgi:hypothetical protein
MKIALYINDKENSRSLNFQPTINGRNAGKEQAA